MAAFGALLRRFRDWRGREPKVVPADNRPADGIVDVAVVRNVSAEPNPRDSRYHRFVRFSEAGDAADRARSRSRARPPLIGRVVLTSIFVGRDGLSWSDDEIAAAHRELERAGEWIEREAMRWNAPTNVEIADTYFRADDDIVEDVEIHVPEMIGNDALFEARAVSKALASASRAVAVLGLSDVVELIESTDLRVTADVRIWLVHLRRSGRSMAVTADLAPIPGVTMAICYARLESFPEPLPINRAPYLEPATLAHEILHLCGATDKYDVSLSRFPRGAVTDRDVMRLDTRSMSRLRVDPGTAAEIGWTNAN
jgi:hypothetical protein